LPMKREIFIHLSFLFSFLILASLLKGWLNLSYWPFWLSGVIGTILPDLDHLIYIFFLRPQELTSQRVSYMICKRDFLGSMNLLAETRSDRTRLIFHTVIFQLLFLILTFFVLTSSNSVMGKGVVLAFCLHLLVDEAVDLTEMGSLANWLRNFPLEIKERGQKYYWWMCLIIFLFFVVLL